MTLYTCDECGEKDLEEDKVLMLCKDCLVKVKSPAAEGEKITADEVKDSQSKEEGFPLGTNN